MEQKQLSIKQNMLWNTVGCLVYQACLWLMTIVVVTLSHGYDNSGALAYAMAIGNIFYPLASYNMRVIQVSDINDEHSSRTYVGFRVFTVVGAYAVITAYLVATTSSMTLVLASLTWLLFKSDEAFCSVFYAIDQKAMRMDYIGISQALRGVLSLGGFSAMLLLTGNIFAAMAAVFVCCLSVTVLFDCRVAAKFADIKPSLSAASAWMLVRKYWPAVATLFCYGAVATVARQYFEDMHGAEMLGIYAAVATPTVIVIAAASYLYSPLIGRISSTWINDGPKAFSALVSKISGVIVAVSVLAVVACELWGASALVLVFGDSISGYTHVLTTAIVAAAITTLFGFLFDVLTAIRNLAGALASNVVAMAISVAGSPFLIEAFFMDGINFAIMIAFGVGSLLAVAFLAVSMRRRSKQTSPEGEASGETP